MINERELKIIAKGGGFGIIGDAGYRVLIFIFQLIIARSLGPAIVGVYALGNTIISIIATITLLGLNRGVIRFIARYVSRKDWSSTVGVILSGVLIIGLSSLVIVPSFWGIKSILVTRIFGKDPQLDGFLSLMVLGIPLLAFRQFFVSTILAFKEIKYRVIIDRLLNPSIKIVALLLSIYYFKVSLTGIAASILISEFVSILFLLMVIKFKLPFPEKQSGEKPKPDILGLLSFSWPLMLSNLTNTANKEIEVLIMGAYVASSQTGIYYQALRVSGLLAVFLYSINSIFAPMITELYEKGEHDRLLNLYQIVTRWCFTFVLPIFIIFYLFSNQIMSVFGKGFSEGAIILQILAFAQLIIVITGPSGWMLLMMGRNKLDLFNGLLVLILTTSFEFILIPKLGILGAAIGVSLALILIRLLRLAEVYWILKGIPYNLQFLKPLFAGLISLTLIIALRYFAPMEGLAATILLSLGVIISYFLMLIVFRIEESDQIIIRKALSKLKFI